jgi:hypothetical protein
MYIYIFQFFGSKEKKERFVENNTIFEESAGMDMKYIYICRLIEGKQACVTSGDE